MKTCPIIQICLALVLVSITLAAGSDASAALVLGAARTITQPDGMVIKCKVTGDQGYSYLHDKDGYVIIKDEDGWYKYAVPAPDGNIMPSEHIVGQVDPGEIGLKKWVTPTPEFMERRLRQKETNKSGQ